MFEIYRKSNGNRLAVFEDKSDAEAALKALASSQYEIREIEGHYHLRCRNPWDDRPQVFTGRREDCPICKEEWES